MKFISAIALAISLGAVSLFAVQPYFQCTGKLKGSTVKHAGYYADAGAAKRAFEAQRKGVTDVSCAPKK